MNVLTLNKIFKLFLKHIMVDCAAFGPHDKKKVNAKAIWKRYYPDPVLKRGMRDSSPFEKKFKGSKTGVKSLAVKRGKERF